MHAIPRGQTLSYGMVAALAGRPGGARAVVRALRAIHGAPWWRVIRADSSLAVEVAAEQAELLEREGVRVVGRKVVGAQREPVNARASSGRRSKKRR